MITSDAWSQDAYAATAISAWQGKPAAGPVADDVNREEISQHPATISTPDISDFLIASENAKPKEG